MDSVLIENLRLLSPNVTRDRHWSYRKRRIDYEKTLVFAKLWSHFGPTRPALPLAIRIVRIGSKLLDSDNLQGSAKGVRDAIANYLNTDDASDLLVWEYAQERSKKRVYAVRLEFRSLDADAEAVMKMMDRVHTCRGCRNDFYQGSNEPASPWCPACRSIQRIVRSA